MSSSGVLGVGGKRDELRLLINSRNPIITVETAEEERLAHLLTALAVELCIPLYTWSVTTGLGRIEGAPIYETAQPEQALANIAEVRGDAIFLLKDFARYCDNDKICRRLARSCGRVSQRAPVHRNFGAVAQLAAGNCK